MVFSSLPFLFFFMPLFFLLYYLFPLRAKNIILLIFSLIFYAWGEPIYIILMIITSFINYLAGRLMEKHPKQRKLWMILSISISLGLLGVYKYGNFIIDNINHLLSLSIPSLDLALPIGISFYTFQAISYIIDLYRKEVPCEKSFLCFMTYISMFPQLIAGPIVRYQTIQEELKTRKINFSLYQEGLLRFIRGLAKKVLLANNIGVLWNMVQMESSPSVILSWLGIAAFAFQIYFDFSGYSDMGIGMGLMLGFHFNENFNYPYISKSITEFWRRWHMSLSTFFKDYVYIPLGGNRCSKIKHIRNILIVWILTGVWHGASWNFILWGLYYGIILLLEKFVFSKWLEKLPNGIKHLYAIILILIGWTIFAFDDINQVFIYLKNMFFLRGIPLFNMETMYLLKNFFILLLISFLASIPLFNFWKTLKIPKTIKNLCLFIFYLFLFIASIAYLVDSTYNPFLYFRF